MLLTSINAGTDYLKIEFAPNLLGGIKFKSAFLHWILHCNFSDQRLKIFQTFVDWYSSYEGTYIEWAVTDISYQALKLTAHYVCKTENVNLKWEKIKRIQFST